MKNLLIGILGIFVYFLVINTVNFVDVVAAGSADKTLYYLFMAAFLLVCLSFIAYPLIRIYAAPEIPPFCVEQQRNLNQLYKYAQILAVNCNYIKDYEQRRLFSEEFLRKIKEKYVKEDIEGLRLLIQAEIDARMQEMDKVVKTYAANTMIITTISQSGKFDLLTSLALNIRLIKEVVELSGFRPTGPQMLRLYYNVLFASMISFAAQGVFDELDDLIDDESLIEGLAGIAGAVLGGATNALMTLRVGFMAQYYLLHGADSIRTDDAKRIARKEVRRKMVKVLPSLFGEVGKKTKDVVASVAKDRIKKFFDRLKFW